MQPLLLLGLALSGTAEAAEVPSNRLVHDSLTAVRLNPLGLQQYYNLAYRRMLFDSDSVLFEDTYVQVGPTVALSPAFVKPGLHIKAKPIALLELTATYRPQFYFGTFDQILGWADPSVDWSDSAIAEQGDRATATGGTQIVLQHRVQAAVSDIAVRNTTRWVYNDLALNDGETVFYDQTPDMLVPDEGWIAVNDLDGIYLAGLLKLGVRWTHTVPFFGNGEGAEGNASDRVGPLVACTFSEKPGRVVDNPTVLVLAQWHAAHRFRTGADVSQAIPYVAIAFLFDGDLIPFQ